MYIIFDQVGDVYEVELMHEMTNDMTNEELEECYKSSSYWFLYTQYLYSLNDEGKINSLEKKFELSQISDAIDIMGKKVIETFGEETRNEWDGMVQQQWEENRK